MEEVAYRLEWDLSHFEKYGLDEQEDLRVVEFAGYDKYAFYREEAFAAPQPLIFSGYPPVVRALDFPLTDNGWTLVSPPMYRTLLAVGDFPHRALPTTAIDCQVPLHERFTPGGQPRLGVGVRDYFTIHITEHLPLFDFAKSVYTRPSLNLPDLLDVQEYAFQLPRAGLPPLFRVAADPIALFISHAARLALRDAGISGPRFISLKGFRDGNGDLTDVAVNLETA